MGRSLLVRASVGLMLVLLLVAVVLGGYLRWRVPEAKLVFAAGLEGGTYLELAKELEEVIEAANPTFSVEVVQTNGSLENAEAIKSGRASLALIQNDTPTSADIRAVVPTHRGVLHVVARRDSGIGKWSDLRGKQIVTNAKTSGSPKLVEALMEFYFLGGETDLKYLPLAEAINALKEGEADGLMVMLGYRSPALLEAFSEENGLVLVAPSESEAEGLDGLVASYPFCERGEIPAMSYRREPATALETISVQSVLVAGADVPKRVVRKVTETVFLHRAELVHRHPALSQMREEFDEGSLTFPLHSGASSYYGRHDPGFLVKYAEVMAFSLSVLLALYGIMMTVRGWMHQREKDRIDAYYLELEKHLARLSGEARLTKGELGEVGAALERLRREAFEQLAGEKLSPDASFLILQKLFEDCDAALERQRRSGS